jgi:hypothetical protein
VPSPGTPWGNYPGYGGYYNPYFYSGYGYGDYAPYESMANVATSLDDQKIRQLKEENANLEAKLKQEKDDDEEMISTARQKQLLVRNRFRHGVGYLNNDFEFRIEFE